MPTYQPPRPKLAAGPSKHVYDVIIIGAQISGALAGALLAKRGLRVLHVEHDGLGPGYEHGDFLLPYAPFLTPPLRMMPAAEEAFIELGLNTTVQRALKPHLPDLQLIFKDRRLDVVGEERRRLAEFSREFGDIGPKVEAAFKSALTQHEASDRFFKVVPDIPPDGMMEGWGVKKLIRNHAELETKPAITSDDPLAGLILSLLPFVTYQLTSKGALSQTRTLSQLLSAPRTYPGGRDSLRELLSKKMTDSGGDFISSTTTDNAIVEELGFDGKGVSVKVVGSENVYRANLAIAATDAGALRRLISDKKKQGAVIAQLDSISTKRYLFTVNWVIKAAGLPRGMGELLIVETGDELSPMLVQLHPAVKKGINKADDDSLRVVCAGCFVASSTRELGEAHLSKLAARMSGYLDDLMPFAKKHLLLSSAPYVDAGGVRGSRLLPHPLFEFQGEELLGISALAQRTDAKSLLLASRQILPGLGFEGELLAGIRAARLAGEVLKKR
jgi:hypothetical protein